MKKEFPLQLIKTIGLNICTTLLLLLLQRIGFTEINIVVIYILSVLIISRNTKGYVYGIIASFLSMLSFNFFFTKPIYTLKVDDSSYIVTLVVMLLSAILTSTLTSKLIWAKDLASKREKQSHILYKITSSLAKTSEISEVASVSSKCLSSLFNCDVTFIINSLDNDIQKFTTLKGQNEVIIENIKKCKADNLISESYSFPIIRKDKPIGYVNFPKEMENIDKENKLLLESIIMQITIAIERIILIRDKETAKSEIEKERFKSNLLRSISHDIRTPLTRITGAAEILKSRLKDDYNIELALQIHDNSTWLTNLVENILSLTKIQEGRLKINKQLEAVEEIISEAVKHAANRIQNNNIKILIPDEVIFAPMDGKLIEQVLVNLINNAISHSNPDSEIMISAYTDDNKVWFEVRDNGTGINEADLPHLFDMFYVGTYPHTNNKHGMGLGLAICKAIVNYHGGEIYAENNPDGGATFKFYLNM